MKKFILTMMLMLGIVTAMSAADTYAHDASVLPEAAKNTIKNNFKAKVSVVKIDKTLGRIDDYDVTLSDGTEIEFDRSGNWKNVETSVNSSVPKGFLPKEAVTFINAKHNGKKVVGIEKKRYGYEIELSDGIDIQFDKNGKFIKYDN